MAAAVVLPQELTDMIIDFLYDDRPALKTCAQVCRPWLRVSFYHLFRDYRIEGTPSFKGGYSAQLNALLQQSFYIHIRDLTVAPLPTRSSLYPELRQHDITAFLTYLPHLRSLKLSQTGFTGGDNPARSSHARFKLEKLSVNWMYPSIPGSSSSMCDLLSIFSEIKELDLRVIHRKHLPSSIESMEALDLSPTLIVCTLTLSDVSPPLLGLLRMKLRSGYLRTVKASVAAIGDVAELGALLTGVGSSLVEFQVAIWNFWSNDYTDWNVLGLSNCPNLESIVILYANSGPYYSWDTVYALLSVVPSTIRDITIVVRDEYCFDSANWSVLLRKLSFFTQLETLQFRLCRGGDLFKSRGLQRKTAQRLWRALPTLKQRGVLR